MSSPSHGGTSTSTSQPAVAPAAALAGSASASPRQQPVENATLGLPAQPTNIAAPVSSTGDITYPPLGPTREESQPLSNVSPPADPPTSSSTPTPALSSTAAFPPTPPSLDQQQPSVEAANANKVALNVLVISGQRKTWRFDGEMTIGRVKEMIWSNWPIEWNSDPVQPPAPSYLRILYRGRMLDDESTLASCNLPVLPSPRSTVVHLSVRTFAIESSGDGKDGKEGDDAPSRPALHTRASSRIRSLVGAGAGSVPSSPVVNQQVTPSQRRRRQSNATNTTDGSHQGGGCACVIC